jgi:hypothetical protein
MRDFVLRLSEQGASVDRGVLKHNVNRLLGDRIGADGSPRYLFSLDPLMEDGRTLRIRVLDLAAVAPLLAAGGAEVPLEPIAAGDSVMITGWLSLQSRTSKPGPGAGEKRERAFAAYSAAILETLEGGEFVLTEGQSVAKLSKDAKTFSRSCAHFTAFGTLRAAEALRDLMQRGVGACKAYGFGLIDVRPI